jgi:tetratricopeptide (TPR) repeat protein
VFVSRLSRRTAILVVGQDGWPLQKDGRLTGNLRRAQALQKQGCPIAVLSEDEFLTQLGLESHAQEVRRLYTGTQLSSLLKIPGDRVRRWLAAGFLRAVKTVNGVSYFDFAQVASARTLSDLTQAGVGTARLRYSLEQLRKWLKNLDQPLLQLAVIEGKGELLVRLKDGLAEPTGQRRLDFGDPGQPPIAMSENPVTAARWFEIASDHEEGARFREAVDAYRQALLLSGPSAAVCFNLGNCLAALGEKERAAERYSQAVEIDGTFADAWNNLGVLLAEFGDANAATDAFKRALVADPSYADALYNLADLCDEAGNSQDASFHWQTYLSLDRCSRWAGHAKRRLDAIGHPSETRPAGGGSAANEKATPDRGRVPG